MSALGSMAVSVVGVTLKYLLGARGEKWWSWSGDSASHRLSQNSAARERILLRTYLGVEALSMALGGLLAGGLISILYYRAS
jgi:hypothetical protein